MTLSVQFYTMIAMICMGGWLGAALDTYGRFLKRSKRGNFIVFINDILFWILQGLLLFYVLLQVNEGELRFYVFIAILCGYAGYQGLLKSSYLKLLEMIIQIVISIYRFLVRTGELFIIRPIKMLLQLAIVVVLGIFNVLMIIGNVLLKVIGILLKICFTPFKWVGIVVWKLFPTNIKKWLEIIFYKCAGFLKKVENMKPMLLNWWKKIRKS